MTTSTATINTVAAAASFHFTKFEVQRVIRLEGEYGDSFVQIDARQDESVLAPIAYHEAIYDRASGLHLIVNIIDRVQFAMIVHESDAMYDLAGSSTDDECTFPAESYGGVLWQVHGHTSDKPEDPFTMLSGNDEATVRNVCAAMQSMIDGQNKVRAYNDNLNDIGKSPDGDDYNEVLNLLGI